MSSSQRTNPLPSAGRKAAKTASASSRTTGGPSRAGLVAVAAPADSTRVAYGSGAWRVKGAARRMSRRTSDCFPFDVKSGRRGLRVGLRLARLFGVQLRRALVAPEADRALVRGRAGGYVYGPRGRAAGACAPVA